jgi:hypothetical protein
MSCPAAAQTGGRRTRRQRGKRSTVRGGWGFFGSPKYVMGPDGQPMRDPVTGAYIQQQPQSSFGFFNRGNLMSRMPRMPNMPNMPRMPNMPNMPSWFPFGSASSQNMEQPNPMMQQPNPMMTPQPNPMMQQQNPGYQGRMYGGRRRSRRTKTRKSRKSRSRKSRK